MANQGLNLNLGLNRFKLLENSLKTIKKLYCNKYKHNIC